MNGSTVHNDIVETGERFVEVENGVVVHGKIDESEPSQVMIDNGTIYNDTLESGSGFISVINDSLVTGNVDESAGSNVTVDAASHIKSNVFEEGQRNCNAVVVAFVDGIVECD